MRYIFISPHLDDVALSCGGIVHLLTRQGYPVLIWTVFAGDPPDEPFFPFATSLHERWQLLTNPIQNRRLEDIEACQVLGAEFLHSPYPDCIYRKKSDETALVNQEEDLYQEIYGNQAELVEKLTGRARDLISSEDILIGPLSIGNHIDHRIVRAMIKNLNHPKKYFYADYPYIARKLHDLNQYLPAAFVECKYNLDKSDIDAWKRSIAAYRSQITTFWESEKTMLENVSQFANQGGGNTLWKNVS